MIAFRIRRRRSVAVGLCLIALIAVMQSQLRLVTVGNRIPVGAGIVNSRDLFLIHGRNPNYAESSPACVCENQNLGSSGTFTTSCGCLGTTSESNCVACIGVYGIAGFYTEYGSLGTVQPGTGSPAPCSQGTRYYGICDPASGCSAIVQSGNCSGTIPPYVFQS